nr:hypothetical protein [uncultured Pseudomonas sp.]
MGIPGNYFLKGYVDCSKTGTIETLFKESISEKEETLASCELSAHEVFVLVERLAWTSIDGDIIYHLNGESSHVVITYPFSRFWKVITNHFSIAQYSDEYALIFDSTLAQNLKLQELRFPHYIRINFPAHPLGEEFDTIRESPHDAGISLFDCRADIISQATYIEGMLHKIIKDSKNKTSKSLQEMTYHEKISFCKKNNLLAHDLLSVIALLKDLRNEAAHQFSFDIDSSTGSFLTVNPASEKLITRVKKFVETCELRYALRAGRIERFHNCARMLAGEINKKANLSQRITLGNQYPKNLSSYFYG